MFLLSDASRWIFLQFFYTCVFNCIIFQQEYQAIVDAEWTILYNKLEKLHQCGVKVVLSKLPIGDVATQYFADRLKLLFLIFMLPEFHFDSRPKWCQQSRQADNLQLWFAAKLDQFFHGEGDKNADGASSFNGAPHGFTKQKHWEAMLKSSQGYT